MFRFLLIAVVSTRLALAASVNVERTFALLEEGERLSASDAAELEANLNRKPNDLENRLRLLAFYAHRQSSADAQAIETARVRHILWIIKNEPKAAVFDIATRVYALQRVGGPFADPTGYDAAEELWKAQISAHPKDKDIKANATTFADVQHPEFAEQLLKEIGNDRWLGQIYAKAILGIVATNYASSDPMLTDDSRRNSEFAKHALADLEGTNSPLMLGGAGFTLCRDGGMLYADSKLIGTTLLWQNAFSQRRGSSIPQITTRSASCRYYRQKESGHRSRSAWDRCRRRRNSVPALIRYTHLKHGQQESGGRFT